MINLSKKISKRDKIETKRDQSVKEREYRG
jgi:hypothetical protein